MTPATVNLEVYQGSTFIKSFQWKTGTPSTPVDITGCTFRMMIRQSIEDINPAATLTTENGGIVTTDAALGKFDIRITSAITSGFNWLKAVYDLEIVYTGGEPVYRLMEGTVTNKLNVTR